MDDKTKIIIAVILSLTFIIASGFVCIMIVKVNANGFAITMDNNTLEAIKLANNKNYTYAPQICKCDCQNNPQPHYWDGGIYYYYPILNLTNWTINKNDSLWKNLSEFTKMKLMNTSDTIEYLRWTI